MKKLKGFTLLELVIVMAIFSIIMYSAVQLLDPVSKFFVRSSNFENTTACIDNMRRCIEGNLKYADRVRAYSKFTPYDYEMDGTNYTGNVTLTSDLKSQVSSFFTTFFENRKLLDVKGTVRVLVFDNTPLDNDLSGYKTLGEFRGKQINQGKLAEITFPFDLNDDAKDEAAEIIADGNYNVNLWSVNQKLYGNFDYTFSMDALSTDAINYALDNLLVTTAASGSTVSSAPATGPDGSTLSAPPPTPDPVEYFNPQDFNITIRCTEIKKKSSGLERSDTESGSALASFSMKNVLNASDGYRTAAYDYKPTCIGDQSDPHSYTVTKIERYRSLETPSAGGDANFFYFIFTVPEDFSDDPNAELYFSKQEIIMSESLAAASGTSGSTAVS